MTDQNSGEEQAKGKPGKNGNYPPKDKQFLPGQSGNPSGKPKGTKSLAMHVRDMMEDENFDFDIIPNIPKDAAEWLKKVGVPWKVLILVAFGKSYSGDSRAMEWLRKSGYGDKLDITSDGRRIEAPLIISPIQKRHVQTEAETETETST